MGIPWPAGVPQCPIPGNAWQRVDARLRTPTDAGPGIMRRRYSATTKNISWTLPPMSGAQFQALDAFWENDLMEGVLPVDITDVLTGTTVEARFLTPPRIVGLVPNPSVPDRIHRVNLELEIMP